MESGHLDLESIPPGLRRELEWSKLVQEASHPRKIPKVPGFEVAGQTAPASWNNGDFFDAIPVEPRVVTPGYRICPAEEVNHLVLLLGDAMGHGMAPALIATELRAILRASIRLGVHHRVLVESMNEQLCDDLPDGHFMTLLMGRLDRQRCLFRWISFGQAPLLLWREKSKKVEVMHAQRPPLGLMRMPADYVPEVTLFDEGDVFLALSDGFFEARNGEGSCWGLEGAKNLLRKEMESAQALATACVRCVEEFSENAPAQDDRTVLVIRRCRGEAEVGGR